MFLLYFVRAVTMLCEQILCPVHQEELIDLEAYFAQNRREIGHAKKVDEKQKEKQTNFNTLLSKLKELQSQISGLEDQSIGNLHRYELILNFVAENRRDRNNDFTTQGHITERSQHRAQRSYSDGLLSDEEGELLMRTTYRQQRKDLIDKYVIFKKLKEEVSRAIEINQIQSSTNQLFGSQFDSVSSFDQLQLEDELEQFLSLFTECEGITELEANIPLQELIVRIYLREIREAGKEAQFEEYLKQNLKLYSSDDLKTINLIHQILDEKEIQHLTKQDRVRREGQDLMKEDVSFKLKKLAEEIEQARAAAKEKYGDDVFKSDQVFEEESKGQGFDISQEEISQEKSNQIQQEKLQQMLDKEEDLINKFKKQHAKLEALKETEREKLEQKRREREVKKEEMRQKQRKLREIIEKAREKAEKEPKGETRIRVDYREQETRARQMDQ